MGFGHREYKNGDPRNPLIKRVSMRLAAEQDNYWRNPKLFSLSNKVEDYMIKIKNIPPNLDF